MDYSVKNLLLRQLEIVSLTWALEMLDSAYFQSDVGGITKLTKNDFGQSTLTKFNDTSHLTE